MIKESDYEPGKEVVCMVQKVWSDGVVICKRAPIKDEDYLILDRQFVAQDQEFYIKLENSDGWFPAKFFAPKDENDLHNQIQEALNAPVPRKKSILEEHYCDALLYMTTPTNQFNPCLCSICNKPLPCKCWSVIKTE